jgi:hypothetical protein
MSVDLDDPWTEDALARPGPPSRAGSSSSNGLNNVAVIQPRSDSTSNSDDSGWGWSPTSPFTPVEDLHTAVARGSPSPTHSPRSSPSLDPNLGFKLNASDPGPKASKLPKQAKHRQKPRRPGPHPLAPGMDGLSLTSDTDISDVSRPALRRATSITERAVAESQEQSRCGSEVGSSRGSVDLARAEVEVIVHQVRQRRADLKTVYSR